MKVGAVISNDGHTVVPLVAGPVIRVQDTETGAVTEVTNPAMTATQARRIAAVQEMLKQGVDVVVAPPSTFCAHSYSVAKTKGMKFMNLPGEIPWEELWANGTPTAESLAVEIPENLLSSHHHHHGQQHHHE